MLIAITLIMAEDRPAMAAQLKIWLHIFHYVDLTFNTTDAALFTLTYYLLQQNENVVTIEQGWKLTLVLGGQPGQLIWFLSCPGQN